MEKDHRYMTVKVMIETKHVTEFRQIFDHIPKSVVARNLGTNNNRMTRMITHVEQFTIKEVYKISELIEIDFREVLNLVATQFLNSMNEKKNKKKV
jgi:hypothetical protein